MGWGLLIISVLMLCVLGVLIAGLWSMARNAPPEREQKLMRWRIGLQFLCLVVLIILALAINYL